MGNLLFLYFLHTITTRLAKKTQRIYPRYGLTNPTKTPPPPFVFSLLSVILLHLHYTLQSPSPSVTTLCSFVTLSLIPLLLPPVPLLPCLLILCYYPPFLCYSVFSSSVTPLCSHVTLSPHPLLLPFVLMLPCLLLPCPASSHPLLLPLVPLLLCLPLPCLLISCRVKNVYLAYPQGPLLCPRQGLSSMQNMPFLPLEDALLACRTCPSWRHVFKSLIVRSLR